MAFDSSDGWFLESANEFDQFATERDARRPAGWGIFPHPFDIAAGAESFSSTCQDDAASGVISVCVEECVAQFGTKFSTQSVARLWSVEDEGSHGPVLFDQH